MTEAEEDRGKPGEVLKGQTRATGKKRHTTHHGMLLAYSEWLDQQGLVIGDGNPIANKSTPRKMPGEDMRSHSDLVSEFLEQSDEDSDE